MPVTTGSHPPLAPRPTFMSALGDEASSAPHSSGQAPMKADGDATPHAPAQPLARTLSNPEAAVALSAAAAGADLRRDSSTTLRSDSTDSSPTTTISTLDSTLTDPSPSSSPESPASHNNNLSAPRQQNMKSLNAHAHDARANSPLDSSPNSSVDASPVRPGSERGDAPSKRFRNAKGLSINTTGINTKQTTNATMGASSLTHVAESSTSSLPAVGEPRNAPSAIPGHVLPGGGGGGSGSNPVTGHAFSAPASPSAIVPSMPPPRRSKLNLTIETGNSDNSDRNGAIPPTPSRMMHMSLRNRGSDLSTRLKPVPETPGLPTPLSAMRETQETGEALFSPAVAPSGGMQLPPFAARHVDRTLPTPGFGPAGGMSLPQPQQTSPASKTIRPALNLPRQGFDAPSSQSVVQHTVSHRPSTPQHELPLSREVKSPGYPNGPVCIYPPSVYLYHQPTRDEAREFDVIINVAREVENPFLPTEEEMEQEAAAAAAAPAPRYKDVGVQCTILPGPEPSKSPEPPTPSSAVSDKTFVSAFERQADEEPETPKANAPPGPFAGESEKKADPEYIHLPWEHNSKVYEEWLRVCQLIDDRVRRGRRVLIHCQLGVSRSASLVVAYGLFRNPRLTPDEARAQAKQRSRWIDLNMHFMYELGDFRKLLAQTYPEAAAAQKEAAQGRMAMAARRNHAGPAPLSRTKTDSFLVGGAPEDGDSPRGDDRSARRASTPNQVEPFEPLFDAPGEVPASAPLRASWSPTSMAEEPEVPALPAAAAAATPEPAASESRQNTPRALPFRVPPRPESSAPAPPAPPTRAAPPPPIDAGTARDEDTPPAPRTAEKKAIHPVPILPPDVSTPATAAQREPSPSLGPVKLENTASDTAQLPPPNLRLPPVQPASGATPAPPAKPASGTTPSPSPTPRRTLRPMPSLPAGFNSSIRSRRLLLHPSAPSPPPAVPPLPLHLQPPPAAPAPLPSLAALQSPTTHSPRPALQPLNAVAHPRGAAAGAAAAEPDGLAGLTSPRAAEFTASPLHCHAHRTSAGDLAVMGAGRSAAGATRDADEDPRSPHAVGREPIVRSIDDVLE